MSASDVPVWIPELPPDLGQFLAPNLQPVPLLPLLAAAMAVIYLIGATSLWVRGRRWSVAATLLFLTGCAVIVVVMGAGIEGYGYAMFSVFMFQQLTLMIAVPPLLILGAPGTLLLRAVPHRGIGRWVLRAALGALRSRAARLALHPAATIPLFLLTYYGLYLSGTANQLLTTWAGHTALELSFLASGILFTVPVLSPDPLPVRQSYLGKVLDMFAEMGLHAFFGVIVMMSGTLLVPYFAGPSQALGVDPFEDQGIAGGLAWSYGEGPTVAILLYVVAKWFRHDTARARQADLKADLQGDAELDAYNDYLQRLDRRGAPPAH